MEKKIIKIIIVGHIDHGKSTLIGRMMLDTNSLPEGKIEEIKSISRQLGKDTELAFLTDQLKEERENEMTIDTTQIFFKTRKNNYVIIDTPGHVGFIKNMLTGASAADMAVLVVDAQTGVMEQTCRHAYLISMLGIDKLTVVLNKMDLVEYKEEAFNKVKTQLLHFLQKLELKPLFIVPISAKCGDAISHKPSRMGWYKGVTLLEALDSFQPDAKKTKDAPLRFPVQDIYKIGGEQIIVGRVVSGIIKKGQRIIILPSFKTASIRAVKVFGKKVTSAKEGENIGLVLKEDSGIDRGDVITEEKDPPRPTERFVGNLFWMSPEPLQIGGEVTMRCATQERECLVEKIEKRINSETLEIIEEDVSLLKINEAASLIFKTKRPVNVEKFSFIKDLGIFTVGRNDNIQGVGIVTRGVM